jgi:hypothetical protein
MQYSLAYQLGERSGGLDPDAKAYIDAVVAAGGTVSGGQKSAINTFYKTGKSDGWYSSLKRLYLPIWASAAPNAIDLIALGSGTFNGTVTHAAGYVNSDGTTGYFDFGVTAASLGLTRASGWMGALMKTAIANHQYLGAQNGSSEVELLRHTVSPAIVTDYNDGSTGRNGSSSVNNGIISASRFGGSMKHFRRATAGRTVAGTYTYADTGSLTSLNCYALAKNTSGSPTSSSTSEMGAWWLGTGVTDTQDSNMTAALKTLWEGCTNLILP